jgi:hypothetical protein
MRRSTVTTPEGLKLEWRAEPGEIHLLDRRTGDVTSVTAIHFAWRRIGERRWYRKVIVPDAKIGQTLADLLEQQDLIVCELDRSART